MGKGNCPNCMDGDLVWDSDCESSDRGYLVEGIVRFLHCPKCGADIEIFIPDKNPYKGE